MGPVCDDSPSMASCSLSSGILIGGLCRGPNVFMGAPAICKHCSGCFTHVILFTSQKPSQVILYIVETVTKRVILTSQGSIDSRLQNEIKSEA